MKHKSNRGRYGNDHLKIVDRCPEEVSLDNEHQKDINPHNSNTRDQIPYLREDKPHGGLIRKSNRDPYGNDHLKKVDRWLEAGKLEVKHNKDKNHQRHNMMDQIPYSRVDKRHGDLRLRSSKGQSGLDQRHKHLSQVLRHKSNREV